MLICYSGQLDLNNPYWISLHIVQLSLHIIILFYIFHFFFVPQKGTIHDFVTLSSAALCSSAAQIQLFWKQGAWGKARRQSCRPLTLNISAASQFSVMMKNNSPIKGALTCTYLAFISEKKKEQDYWQKIREKAKQSDHVMKTDLSTQRREEAERNERMMKIK